MSFMETMRESMRKAQSYQEYGNDKPEENTPVKVDDTPKVPLDYEYRYRCKVCGTVFCYTEAERQGQKLSAVVSVLASTASIASHISGSSYHGYEQGKIARDSSGKIKNFSKCPKCNSSSLEDISNSDSSETSNQSPSNASTPDYVSILEQLSKLRSLGIITDEEFQQKKTEILAKM